jgi:hypothetical protein
MTDLRSQPNQEPTRAELIAALKATYRNFMATGADRESDDRYEDWANTIRNLYAPSHASLKARVEELEAIARQSRSAMLRTRAASIAGCEEGYGRPEKWGEELFCSHGDLTAAIRTIDAALPQSSTPAVSR